VSRRAVLVLGLAGLLLIAVPVAGATAVSQPELRTLAQQARSDPAAVDRLRAVTRVDGVPVDLRSALAGAQGAELQRRLAALAGGTRQAVDAAQARREAREVLSGSRYQPEDDGFHPLRGVLGWIGDRLAPLGRPFSWLGDHIPGGMDVVWALAGLITLLGAVLVAQRVIRGRVQVAPAGPRGGRRSADADPAALEHAADQAEREGDYERAVRLRFRAGLVRLARLRAISDDVTSTNGQVARELRSSSFDELAGTHDEVVYGGRPAARTDAVDARGGWDDVLDEARRR
jgi:hypothetical protein